MAININNIDGVPVIEISETFDITTSGEVRDSLNSFLDSENNNNKGIILDLSGINFIDSTAIGVIVKSAVTFREIQKKMVVINKSPNIKKLFTMANLNNIIDIVEDIDNAKLLINN